VNSVLTLSFLRAKFAARLRNQSVVASVLVWDCPMPTLGLSVHVWMTLYILRLVFGLARDFALAVKSAPTPRSLVGPSVEFPSHRPNMLRQWWMCILLVFFLDPSGSAVFLARLSGLSSPERLESDASKSVIFKPYRHRENYVQTRTMRLGCDRE
jgi:hypothetical protein